MKIFCPINENSNIVELVKYADEFYLSYINEECTNNSYHTRDFNEKATFKNIDKLKEMISIINQNNKEVFLTCNAHSHSNKDLNDIKKIMYDFKRIGGHGFIVSDLNTLKIANELGIKTYLSTIFAIYNIEAVKGLLKKYKIDRLILSRDVSYYEIKKIKEELPIEIECFIFLSGCRFSNGNCFCKHLLSGGMCKFSMDSNWKVNGNINNFDENHKAYSKLLIHGCGICAIYDFLNLGIDSIKITGRELDCQYILDICKNIKRILNVAEESETKKEFIAKISQIDFVKKIKCDNGYDCFYPEIGKWMEE